MTDGNRTLTKGKKKSLLLLTEFPLSSSLYVPTVRWICRPMTESWTAKSLTDSIDFPSHRAVVNTLSLTWHYWRRRRPRCLLIFVKSLSSVFFFFDLPLTRSSFTGQKQHERSRDLSRVGFDVETLPTACRRCFNPSAHIESSGRWCRNTSDRAIETAALCVYFLLFRKKKIDKL